MKRRAFLGLGATSIGVGAMYGTGALSSVSAGRGVSVSAADDLTALLGLDPVDGVIEVSDNEPIVAELTNNSSEQMTVSSLEVISIGTGTTDDDLVEVAEPIQGDTISTDGTDVTVRCNSDEDIGEESVTIRADVSTSSFSIDRANFDVTLDIQCDTGGNTASGFQSVFAGDVNGTDPQLFSFQGDGDIKSNATITIDLSSVDGVDYSDATANLTAQRNNNDEAEFVDENTIEISLQGNAQEFEYELEVEGYVITGNTGDEYVAQFGRSDSDQRDADSFVIE